MLFLKCFKTHIPTRFAHKYTCKMNKAYLRFLVGEETEKFEISFQVKQPELKIDRQFNLCRNSSETISAFLSRIATNVEKKVKKKKSKEPASEPVITTSLKDDSGNELDGDASCKQVFVPETKLKLSILGSEYEVLVNPPWVCSISLPGSVMAGYKVYPNKLETMYTDLAKSEFSWFKSTDNINWELVDKSFLYTSSNQDVNSYLKLVCLPKNEISEGPSIEVEPSVKVEAGPGPCPFESRHQFTKNKCQGDTFRVVSYNILADLYADQDYTRQVLHPYCPEYALKIDYRKQLVIKELLGYNADIICLQEVDRSMFKYDYTTLFNQLGFQGDLCLKTGDVAEGVALFFDTSRFRRVANAKFIPAEDVSTNELFLDLWRVIKENEQLTERIMTRSSVLQVNVLESLDRDEVLVVANTHLYFHPDADHIRLLQAGMMIRYLEKYVADLKAKLDGKKRTSLIFCGDFNSTPECGIYELYTTGQVPQEHVDYKSNADEAVSGIQLKQSFSMESACGTPEFTNFTAGFAACLDYIFYQTDSLEVRQVVPFPSTDELNQNTALPSIVFPSDHISLISDLKWKQ